MRDEPQISAGGTATVRLAVAVLAAVFLVLAASGAAAYFLWPPTQPLVSAEPAPPRIWNGEAGAALPGFARADHAERAAPGSRRQPAAGPRTPEARPGSAPPSPVAIAAASPLPSAAPTAKLDAPATQPSAHPPRRPGIAEPPLAALEEPDARRALARSPRPAARPFVRQARAAEPMQVSLTGGAANEAADTCVAAHAGAMPARATDAPGGQAALARIGDRSGSQRDAAIAEAVVAGNIPDFQRRLVPVTLDGRAAGAKVRITLCVMPDYLALGHDRDFVRVPLGLPAASRIAERFGMLLPTARMVDAIHAQAQAQLSPQPMTPGPQMESTAYFLRHNATIEAQRQRAGAAAGTLVAGHKKDLVLTNRLADRPGRVAIYGWHHPGGEPIQPLSTVHGAGYADYSHGLRLVGGTAFVDGRPTDLRALLSDARYAGILSDEGALGSAVPFAALR